MFWGLILKANKKYTQTIEKPFHLTKACLDYSNADDNPIQVMYSDGSSASSNYLICTLQKGKKLQCALDLTFNEGDKLCFSTKGNGIIHLTGYLIPEDDFNYDPMMDDSENELEEEESEEEEAEVPDLREKLLKKKKEKEKLPKKGKKAPVEEDSEGESDEDEELENGDVTLDSSGVAAENDSDDDEEASDDEDDSLDEDESELGEESDEEEEEVQMPPKKQAKLDPELQKKQKNGLENGQQQSKKDKKDKQKDQKPQQQKEPQKERKLQGGLAVLDLKPGNGAEAKPGKKIQVYYEGRLKQNNKVFDSTKSGPGFKMTLGRGEVIKAWDIGLVGMKVGGKRRLTCPPGLAYGAKGNPPVIPANSVLVFDVELKNVL